MKRSFIYPMMLCVLVCAAAIYVKIEPSSNLLSNNARGFEESYPHDKQPELVISREEQAVNKRYQDRLLKHRTYLKSTSNSSSIADGKLNGTWDQFQFLTRDDVTGGHLGFRVDGSLYDKENDIIYAVSYAGHLYRINRSEGNNSVTGWELLNHNYNFLTHSYNYWNWTWKYLDGLNKPDGSYRMIRSVQDGMEYSDNEGRDWIKVANLSAIESASEGAIAKTEDGIKIFVLVKKSPTHHQVHVSVDNGVTYSSLPTSFNPNDYFVKMFKAYNSESVFIAAYNKASSKMSIYEHIADGVGFELINISANTMLEPDSHYSFISATLQDGRYHFYIGCNNEELYYSSDKGASWTHTIIIPEADYGTYVLRDVHPAKPFMVFRGFLDFMHSKDYGKTWQGTNWHIGWDVQHMKFYQRKDSSYFLFVGNDMGCFINDNPEVKEEFVQLNNASPSQMCYDAVHGHHTYSSFSALQDRGTLGFKTKTNSSITEEVQSTDALRVELTNNETSVWTWLYYGSIFRKASFVAGSSDVVGIHGKGNWWAAPMVPTPNQKEDAVYLAYGSRLSKLTYNPVYNKIVETLHHYDFSKVTGSKITGFGYSKLNKNRWYVSVANGDFYYSVDGGQTFEKTSYTGTKPYSEEHWHKLQHVIRASKTDEKTVYFAGKGNLFLISKDGGKTFSNHNNGLDVVRIIDFDVTSDDKFIFAACWGAGAWVYSADTDQWYPVLDVAIPASGINFTDAEYIDKKNEIRFGTYGSGILSFTIDGQEPGINYPDMLCAEVSGGESVILHWQDKSNNEDGFLIERAKNGEFTELARVNANQTAYTDSGLPKAGNYIYRLKAFNSSDTSYNSNYAFANVKANREEVPKREWTLVSVDNEAYGYAAIQAFDGNPGTIWHTQWGINPLPDYPHTLVVDMNQTITIKGFGYLPRQDYQWNGSFKDFEFYVSTDNKNWTKMASGSWPKTIDNKAVAFDAPITARYIKLVGLNEIDGAAFGSCAEVSVYTDIDEPTAPNAPLIIQGGRISNTAIEITWLDLSMDEDGFVVEQLINGDFNTIYTTNPDETSFLIDNADKNETYTLQISAFNSKGYSSADVISIKGTGTSTAIKSSLTASEFSVYPNPVSDILNINLSNPGEYSNWQIIDLNGRIIKEGKLLYSNEVETIDIQELKAGTYIINLQSSKMKLSKTIIKK